MNKKEIPQDAKMVYKGQRRTIWQREQKGFDGRSEIYEKAQRLDSVQGVAIDGDKILLPNELHPLWDAERVGLFGGILNEGEDPLVGMKREFLEEVGMRGDIEYWRTVSHSGSMIMDVFYYIIRNPVLVQEPEHDPGEKITLIRFTFEEFMGEVLKPTFRNSDFANYIIREYILPGKEEALRTLLFGA